MERGVPRVGCAGEELVNCSAAHDGHFSLLVFLSLLCICVALRGTIIGGVTMIPCSGSSSKSHDLFFLSSVILSRTRRLACASGISLHGGSFVLLLSFLALDPLSYISQLSCHFANPLFNSHINHNTKVTSPPRTLHAPQHNSELSSITFSTSFRPSYSTVHRSPVACLLFFLSVLDIKGRYLISENERQQKFAQKWAFLFGWEGIVDWYFLEDSILDREILIASRLRD